MADGPRRARAVATPGGRLCNGPDGLRHLAWIKNALDQKIWEQAQPSAH